MIGLVIIGFVSLVLLYGADRLIKARARARRRKMMSGRLAAAAVRADRQQERRATAARASVELTSVIPAISRPPLVGAGQDSAD